MPGLLLIPPLVYCFIHFYLNASGTLWLALCLNLPLILVYVEIRLNARGKSFLCLRIMWIGAFILLVAGFLLFIIMLPESLYQAWLKLLDAGKQAGMISFAFAWAGGLVSSVGCASLMLWENKVQALLNLLLLCTMVALILYPLVSVFLLFLTLLLIKLFLIQKENPRPVILLSFLTLFIPSLTVAFLFPLDNPTPRGSRFVDNISGTVQKTAFRLLPGLPLVLHIPGYGYGYDQVRETGDRPVLSSNIIFTVDADPGRVLYLRSDVFYRYMNGVWLSEYPGQGSEVAAIGETESYREILLTVETDLYTRVLHNSWTVYYGFNGGLTALNAKGSYETSSGLPLSRGDQIILYDRVGKGPVPDDETLLKQLEQGSRVPSDLESELRDLAELLAGESVPRSLANIKNYFKEEFKYTLDTKSSDQMVLDFLNVTREGYCVHFSTSAALLARTLGIPVRLAEGFLVQIPEYKEGPLYNKGNSYAVTGYSAHQWPEIYIEDRGWIPWEVTPPFEELGEFMIQDNMNLDDYTREQLMRIGVFGIDEAKDDHTSLISPFHAGLYYWIIPLGLILMVGIVSVSLYRSKKLVFVINRKVKQAEKRFGTAPPSETGWMEWFRVQNSIHKNRCQNLILKFVYHKDSLRKNEKKELLKLLKEL